MSRHKQSLIMLFAAALLWSTGGILIKSIELPGLAIAGLRSFVALPLFWLFMRRPKFIWTPVQWMAALSFALTVSLFCMATKMTTAANAILLQYSAPVYVAIFSHWYLKEKINWTDWLVVGVVLAGMTLFFFDQLSTEGQIGNILALISGFTFAWITLFLRKQNGVSTAESLFLGNVLTVLFSVPTLVQLPALPTQHDLLLILLLGTFQLGLPYILFATAIRHVTALEGILVPIMEPILNPVWVAILVGEMPSKWALAGGAIVLSAVLFQCLKRWAASTVESTM